MNLITTAGPSSCCHAGTEPGCACVKDLTASANRAGGEPGDLLCAI